MFFDTHCHLNFGAFDGRVERVISDAKKAGVNQIVIPGTDLPTSKKAIEIAEKYEGVYVAVGIHPHHIFDIYSQVKAQSQNFLAPVGTLPVGNGESQVAKNLDSSLVMIEQLLSHPKVVAIGEVGIDRHIYQKTKYPDYKIAEEFVELQKFFLIEQIKLASKYKKSLILHNREAKKDIIEVLTNHQSLVTNHSSVFHCCEPDPELLEFAKQHKMLIGVDGDVTYSKSKQEFIKNVPLEMLVLETDSPFLTPRYNQMQLDATGCNRTQTRQKNEPKNIKIIAEFVAKLKKISVDEVAKQTTENARRLFRVI